MTSREEDQSVNASYTTAATILSPPSHTLANAGHHLFTMEGGVSENVIHVINPAQLPMGALSNMNAVTTSVAGIPNLQTITISPANFPIPVSLTPSQVNMASAYVNWGPYQNNVFFQLSNISSSWLMSKLDLL